MEIKHNIDRILEHSFYFMFLIMIICAILSYSALSGEFSIRDIAIITIVNSGLSIGMMCLILSLYYGKRD